MYARLGLLVAATIVVSIGALAAFSLSHPAGANNEDEEHEPTHLVIHGNRTTSCGVERWTVKTGMDRSAKRVDLHPIATNIYHLRSLPAPAQLPSTSRVGPVELHTYSVVATILRVKEETDSDYHLVLADAGGRTMIAEIPSPACISAASPFRNKIAGVRGNFTARYHPSDRWSYPNVKVRITGVGFFDFKHGQSGVAPNAIELHPVLAIQYTNVSSPLPPAPPQKPAPKASGKFSLSVSVSPSTMSHNAYPSLTAHTVPGASCTASVRYSTGYPPRSFDGSAKKAGSSGTITWGWHEETSGSGGTATVTCSYRGQSKTASASFSVG